MTVSAITGVTIEGQPQELSSFLRAGVVYVLWHTPITSSIRRLSWKPHNAGDFAEVVPALGLVFRGIASVYDPATDRVLVVWDDGTAVDSSTSGSLLFASFHPTTGTLLSGPTTLFPGSNPKLVYHPKTLDTTWVTGPTLQNAVIAPLYSTLSNGDLVVTGGDTSVVVGLQSRFVQKINLAGTSVTPLGQMNYGRSYHQQVTLPGDKLFVLGGNMNGGVGSHRGEIYNPTADSWALTPAVPNVTAQTFYPSQMALLRDGRVAVVGGEPKDVALSPTSNVHHLYDPATNSWSDMGTPAVTGAGCGLVTLPDGRVLKVGGWTRAVLSGPETYYSTCELWNPNTRAWTTITSLPIPIAWPQVTVLRDGSVLVCGGWNSTFAVSSASTASFVYTPDAGNGTWKIVGNLVAPAVSYGGQAAAVFDDGSVLVVGQNDPAFGGLTRTTNIYDPVAQTWSRWADLPLLWGEGLVARLNGNRVIHLGGDLNDTYVEEAATRTVTGPLGPMLVLYYRTAKNGGVYGRASKDGGQTWASAYPLITGKVSNTTALDVSAYSRSNVSVAQLGAETRQLREISSLQRTRPLTSVVKHPTVANQLFIGEPSKFDNVTLTDNLRGGLVLATDNSKLYHLDGVAQGTSDGVGAVALVTVTGTTFSISASAGPTGNGDDINSYTLIPASDTLNVDLPNASCAVALDVSSTHGYIAEYTDNGTLGQFIVVDLSSGSTGTVLSALTGVRAVAVANFLATPLIFVATSESGVEYLRIYQQNGLTPTLLMPTAIPKLTSRANFLSVAMDPSNPTGVLIYASLVDRLNVYQYTSASTPVQLKDSLTLPGGGSFFQSKVASNGNVAVAAGNAGVLVLDPDGKILAQTPVSGESVLEWRASTVYTLNALVRPRESHQFARSRYYFKATTGGTSGVAEPLWTATGTVLDNTAQWQAVGLVDGVAVGLELDEDNARILVAGSAGGNLGTDGRVWMVSAAGLVLNRGHVLDANTLALWRFDNLGGTVESDISGNGYALTSLHDSTSILGKIRYARKLTGNSGTGLWSAAAPSAITPLHGEYTVEAWIRTNALSNGVLLGFRVPGGVSYPSQDPLLELGISGPGTFLYFTVYYGSGPLYNYAGANAVTNGVWTHVAGRKRLNGAGPNYDLHVFVNGVKVGETLNVPGPSIGDGNDASGAWAVGSTYPGTGPFALYTNVDVDDIRVSKVARTDAEILSSYNRGAL